MTRQRSTRSTRCLRAGTISFRALLWNSCFGGTANQPVRETCEAASCGLRFLFCGVGVLMAEERPYSLLIRLGVILAPILAGALLWSYRYPPAAVWTPKPPAVIPAPLAAGAPKPAEPAADAADPVANAASAATMTMPPSFAEPSVPERGALRGVAAGSRTAATQPAAAGPAATKPAMQGPPQPTTPPGDRRKAREVRKQEAASTHKAIQKLDKEIDRKLSICSGC
jgi:hypothetical protein